MFLRPALDSLSVVQFLITDQTGSDWRDCSDFEEPRHLQLRKSGHITSIRDILNNFLGMCDASYVILWFFLTLVSRCEKIFNLDSSRLVQRNEKNQNPPILLIFLITWRPGWNTFLSQHCHWKSIKMSSSLELANRMRIISIDSSCDVTPPPDMLSACNMLITSTANSELDCKMFDVSLSSCSANSSCSDGIQQQSRPAHEGRGMIKGWGSAISRNRCVSNLSALGSMSSESNARLTRPSSQCYGGAFGTGGSWGYYVDTFDDWGLPTATADEEILLTRFIIIIQDFWRTPWTIARRVDHQLCVRCSDTLNGGDFSHG